MLHDRSAGSPGSNTANATALSQYRQRAGIYDLEMALWEPIRREAVALLGLRQGDKVLDVGCGTGLSFGPMVSALGDQGRIFGIEQSPEMIEKARERVAHYRWDQVALLCSPVAEAPIPVMADAALFHFTHDILQQPMAIAQVMRHLKPGARVVASGIKWAGPWNWTTNLFVLPAALHSVSSLAGLEKPWRQLAWHLPRLDLQTWLNDGVYIASGVVGE